MTSVRLVVRLTPRAGQDRIDGWATDAAGRPLLLARVTSAPADGQANAALLKLIAKTMGLPPSAVSIASGAASRVKTLKLEGADEALIQQKLGAPAA